MRPDLAKLFLLGLTGLVVVSGLATAAYVARDWVSGFGRKGVPTVMVLSRQTLQAGAAANYAEGARKDAAAKAVQGSLEEKQKSPRSATAATTDKVAGGPAVAADASEAEHKQAISLELVTAAMEDELGGAIVQALGESGRFQPIPSNKVSEALSNARQKGDVPEAKPVTAVASTGTKTRGGGQQSAAAVSTISTPVTTGLKEVAAKLGAEYTIVVSIGEPRLVYDVIERTDYAPPRLVLSAQPVISCELFSNKTSEAYHLQKQFDKRISATVALGSTLPNVGNARIAIDRVNAEISRIAAQDILAWALDKVAPARIMKTGAKLVINRGANDGMVAGAVFSIERETGDPIIEGGEGGINLGRLRQPVGSIVIQDVQERIATATIASGGPMLKDDIVKVVRVSSAGSPAAPQAQSGTIPLGAQAIAQADSARTSGVAERQANVAVDHVVVNGREASTEAAQLVADALARDPRITILPRAQLGQLLQERARNAAATNDYESVGYQGMRASGYLINGDFRTSSSRHAKTISVGGITQTVSTSTSTSVSGVLRATDVDGKQVQSVQVSGAGSLSAATQSAARAMLLRLFPMSVVQVAGGSITVDRGQDAGLRVGSRLKLYHLGKPIINKQTGALLSQGVRSLSGEAVVSDVEPNVSTAQLVGSPPVAEGDLVEIGGIGTTASARPATLGSAVPTHPAKVPVKKGAPAKPKPVPNDGGLHF